MTDESCHLGLTGFEGTRRGSLALRLGAVKEKSD